MNDDNTLFDPRAERYGEKVISNVRTMAMYSLIAVAIGLLFAALMARCWPGLGVLAMAALACFAVGGGFGFLFSIPRSAQAPEAVIPPGTARSSDRKAIPRDNTNLEQISDWLVKLLIGAGLVQLDQVKSFLESSATKLSTCLLNVQAAVQAAAQGGAGASGVSAPTPVIPYCTEFCLFLILYFLAVGFLSGYLVTKLWLPYVILRSALAMELLDRELDDIKKRALEKGREEGTSVTLQKLGIASPDKPPPKPGEGNAASVENIALADPNKGKFGGSPTANNLTLKAEVDKFPTSNEYFQIVLKVVTDGTRTLDQPVTFHLHPTFKDEPAPVVMPAGNEAVLQRAAWGAFTVGVTIQGEPTKLELDLAELPDAPAVFRSR